MSGVFGKEYAVTYDLLYQDKDYLDECELIIKLSKKFGNQHVQSILDLGCGTGNHVLCLAEKGYLVCGVDRSDEMLNIARLKAGVNGISCSFHQSDIRDFRTSQKFDVVIMMFAVLGYHLENEDVLRALGTVREHLNPGGLFICDVWYGPAVLHQRPGERVRIIEDDDERKIIRVSSGELDSFHHRVHVNFHVWDIQRNLVIAETCEDHAMRFFFAQELSLFLECAGIKMVHMGPFPDYGNELNEQSWNCIIVGKKI